MVFRNLGYGIDGRGGFAADATQGTPVGPNANRNTGVQGPQPTPPAKLPIVTAATTSEVLTDVAKYIFKSAVDNTVSCNIVSVVDQDEVESGTRVNIAKPPHLRKRLVDTDGEEVNGEIVTYAPDELLNLQGTRKREFQSNGGTVTLFEKIDPPYTADETIFAANVQATGEAGIRFQDLNVQARRWVNIEPREKYFVITEVDRDSYVCQEWDFNLNVLGGPKLDSSDNLLPSVNVAKPHGLRGLTWDGETLGGVGYIVDGGDAESDHHKKRDADDGSNTENHEVLPRWIDDVSIIRAMRVDVGTGVFRNSVQSIWQDTNDDSRAFSVEFA